MSSQLPVVRTRTPGIAHRWPVRGWNERGRDLYSRLGYAYAGPYRNGSGPDAPVFDLLLLQVGGA